MTAGFRYFDVKEPVSAAVRLRGNMKGVLHVRTKEDGPDCGQILVTPSKEWKAFGGNVEIPAGEQEIYFVYEGRGKLDMLEFALKTSVKQTKHNSAV